MLLGFRPSGKLQNMTETRSTHKNIAVNTDRLANSSEILLSLLAASSLMGMVVWDSVLQNTQELGRASEEVFRGDRLPLLNFPETVDAENRA